MEESEKVDRTHLSAYWLTVFLRENLRMDMFPTIYADASYVLTLPILSMSLTGITRHTTTDLEQLLLNY